MKGIIERFENIAVAHVKERLSENENYFHMGFLAIKEGPLARNNPELKGCIELGDPCWKVVKPALVLRQAYAFLVAPHRHIEGKFDGFKQLAWGKWLR